MEKCKLCGQNTVTQFNRTDSMSNTKCRMCGKSIKDIPTTFIVVPNGKGKEEIIHSNYACVEKWLKERRLKVKNNSKYRVVGSLLGNYYVKRGRVIWCMCVDKEHADMICAALNQRRERTHDKE